MSLGVVPEHERSAQRQRGCVGSQVVILPQFVRSAAIGSHQRISLIAIIPIAAGAFVATNLDNFILLVALLARYRNHTSNVIAGYFAGVLSLGFVGLWIGKAANIAPVEYLGLLGFVPISIGTVELIQLLRGRARATIAEENVVRFYKDIYQRDGRVLSSLNDDFEFRLPADAPEFLQQ